jgi:endonuclease G
LAYAEGTFVRKNKRKNRFSFVLRSLIRTFAPTMKRHLYFVLAIGLLLTGCKREAPQSSGQMNTFSSKTYQQAQQAQQSTSEQHPESAQPVNLLKQRVGRGVSEIMLTRIGYVTSYNKQTRCPNWVAWKLTKAHTYGKQLRDNERFEEDFDVPEPRATYQDYYNSRYDRGHMCPAGDNKWDEAAMTESFLMTNICPQNHGLNKEDWNDLEMQCRTWARRYGELTIVCGPLFEEESPRLIGRNKVTVPSAFFKVVYRDKPEPQAVGFIFGNHGRPQPWREQVVSVDEVERRSGINFFLMLPDDVEDRVEACDVLDKW